MRLIMVSRPEGDDPVRGLIITLSNPGGSHFTPVSAPIVLRRVVGQTPQLGYIRPDAPDYEAYRRDLEMVMPTFGFFAEAPRPISDTKPALAGPVQDVYLAVVR
jgi:hypothetical protein